MVRVAGALSNGGIIYVPTLVDKIVNPDGEVAYQFQPKIASRLDASPKNLEAVRRACWGVVREGTGKAGRLYFVDVGGKTGTAQVVSLGKEAKGKDRKKTEDHAWFVCFAPVEDSEIAVAVIIEHGGHGGTVAAPPAREVMREFFKLKDKDSEKTG